MKAKKILAALICATTFLTGCATASGNRETSSQSSANADISSTEYAASTPCVEQDTSSTSISTSTTSLVVPEKVEPKIPTPIIDESAIELTDDAYYIRIPFKLVFPFDNDVDYYVTILSGTSPDSLTVTEDSIFDTSHRYVYSSFQEGDNYFRIKFSTDKKQEEYSKIFHYYYAPVKHKEFSFYSMLGAYTGLEILFGYPDYDEVDYYLRRGITPETISVDVYFRCPHCSTETYVKTVQFSYSKNEMKLLPNYYCSNKKCAREGERKIFSRIVE